MKQKSILFLLLMVVCFCTFWQTSLAQNSNVTVSTAATSGGSWSGGTTGPYIFTPAANSANILNTDIQNRLIGSGFSTNNVTIVTTNAAGTQAGDVIVSTAITATATGKTFTITASGAVAVNAAVTLTPANASGNTAGSAGSNFTIVTAGSITIAGVITTNGGKASSSGTFGSGGSGGQAGNISFNAAGSFSNSGILNAQGGDGASATLSFTGRSGGSGGTITVVSGTSLTVGATITSKGGAGVVAGNGGTGGPIVINAGNGALVVNTAIASTGGGGTSGSAGSITISAGTAIINAPITSTGAGVSGNASDVSLTGSAGITLAANLSSIAGGVGSIGDITINDGGATVTSGGTNDGQTSSSVINAGNLIKNGAGTFNMAGTNSYTGNTTINAGKIRVSSAVNTGASTNGALGNNGLLGTATISISNGGLEFNAAAFTRAISLSGNTTLDAYGAARSVSPALSGSGTLTIGGNTIASGAGQDLTLTGVISGSIAVVKSFSSLLTLTATNTFTGTKTLNAGTLNINNSNALGTVAAAFTINGGTLDNTTAAAITTLNYLQTWAGDFAFTGTQSLNLGTAAVTMTANRNVAVNANTLTVGGTIAAPSFSLVKSGGGTLAFGSTAKTFNSITVSAGGLTSTSNTLSIAGSFSNSGTFTHNSGMVTFNGSTQSISGSSVTGFNTLNILNGSTTTGVAASTAVTFNINNGAKYIQTSGTTIPGTTKNFVAGSIYELQATSVTFSGSTYGTLIINFASGTTNTAGVLTSILNNLIIRNTGTGSFSLASNTSPAINIAGYLETDGGKLILSTGTGTPSITVNGDVKLYGGTLQGNSGAGASTVFVKGNWINNTAVFTAGTSRVTFNSTAGPQNISGSSPNNFYNLTNSNTDFSGLSLDADITVTNVLSFASSSNGIFSTGSNTVFVTNNSVGAITQPGAGYVIGNLKRTIASTGGLYNFPVGSFIGYTPASLSFNSGNTAGNVNVTTTDGVSFNYPFALSSTNQLARTWTITNGGGGSFSADGVFTFLPDDLLNGATAAALKGYKFDDPAAYTYSANTATGANSFSFNGITSFSEFGAGECAGTLSVDETVTNVTCNSGSDGMISSIVSGNSTPVTYLWNTNPVQTTPDISGLIAGSYMITVTEQTTCNTSNTFVVTQPDPVPAPVSGGDQVTCSDGTTTQTLTATASGGTISWYDAATGGNLVSSPTQTGVGAVTYYAQSFDGTCSSLTRTAVTLTINPVPAAAVSGGDQTVCENGDPNQILTATASSTSGTITWYDMATGGNTVSSPTKTGIGSITYYAEVFDGTCTSLVRTPVTLTINAAPAPPVANNQTICSDGTTTQTLTATASGGTISWYDAATGGNLVSSPTQTGVGSTTYYAQAFNGNCNSLTRTGVTLTINPVPAPAVSGGNQTVCENGDPNQILTATASSTGGTITWYDAAAGGNTVSSPTKTGTGSVTYYAEVFDGTCTSLTRTAVTLTINAAPAAPVANNQTACSNGSSSQTLTATATGGIITWYDAATGGNVVSSPTQTGPGTSTYYAQASNGTCSSLSRTAETLTISIPPAVPGSISGPTNACPYIGTGETVTYSIAPVPNATGYLWTIPSTVSIVSGQGTTSLTITVNTGFDASPNPATRLLRVKALSSCGNSADKLLYLLAQFPNTPGPITGPTNICALIGTANTATYTINKVIAATSYAWTLPAGTTAVHPNGTSANDTVIVVTFGSGFASSAISVAAVNGCGTSGSVRSIFINRTASSVPGLISGPTNVCSSILPSGSPAVYSITPVSGAASYTWTAPAGSVFTHPNGAGANDVTFSVQFPAGFTGGNITVSSTNGCGTSAVRSLAVSKLSPATPGVIDVIQTANCTDPGGRVFTYTIAAMPANASSVQWSIPAGALLVSGQGSQSITVSYSSNAVQGNVTAQAVNDCGASSVRTSPVKLAACPPASPGFAKGGDDLNKTLLLTATNEGLSMEVFPNPTVAKFTLRVITTGKEIIHVRISDLQGREFKNIVVMPYQTINIGADLKAGVYFAEVIQGKNKITQKLLKF